MLVKREGVGWVSMGRHWEMNTRRGVVYSEAGIGVEMVVNNL